MWINFHVQYLSYFDDDDYDDDDDDDWWCIEKKKHNILISIFNFLDMWRHDLIRVPYINSNFSALDYYVQVVEKGYQQIRLS